MAGRHPSREDRALWRRSMRGVTPLAPERAASAPEEAAATPEPARSHRPVSAPAKSSVPLPPLAPGTSPGVDRRTAAKLKRGQLALEARLDLHGLTQEEAHRALTRFIRRAHEDGARMVLVITGKGGLGGGKGVLRDAVPRWLNESGLRPRVLSCAWAQPKDGGAGALYVLLRRQR